MRDVYIIEFRKWRDILVHQAARAPSCWFYLGTDYRSHTQLKTGLGTGLREIEFGQEYHETVTSFRQTYVDYIATLYAASSSTGTRYSGFLEKSPFISCIFQNACFIRLALRLLKRDTDDAVFIVCQENVLAHDLFLTLQHDGNFRVQMEVSGSALPVPERISLYAKGCIRLAFTGLGMLFRKIMRHPSAKKAKMRMHHGSDIILIHTWLSRNSSANGEYREGFFGDLQEKLAGLGYTPVLIPHIPYDLSFRQGISALARSGKLFVPEEYFLSFRALSGIFRSCVCRIPRWNDYIVDGIVISNNVYYQEYRDFEHLQMLMPLLWEAIIRNFSETGIRIRSFILLHENYSFEKAIIRQLRICCGDCTTIGYQHSTVTSNHISYCLSRDGSDRDTLPDRVIANGTFPRSILIRNNYPEDLVVAGGALRYAGDAGLPPCMTSLVPNEEKYTLLTLPGVMDESVELLEKVYEALGTGRERVMVKVHPFIPVAGLKGSVKKDILQRFEFTSEPLEKVLPGARLLIYSTSSTCIEALSFGIPVLRVLSDRRLDIDPLQDFRQKTPYIGVATHPHEIAALLGELSRREFSESEKKERAEIVRSIFGEIDATTYALFTYSKKYGYQH